VSGVSEEQEQKRHRIPTKQQRHLVATPVGGASLPRAGRGGPAHIGREPWRAIQFLSLHRSGWGRTGGPVAPTAARGSSLSLGMNSAWAS